MKLTLDKALEFNFKPQSYLHPGWGRLVPYSGLVSELHESGCCETDLSEYLLNAFKLGSNTDFAFDLPKTTFVALSDAELNELFVRAGLLQCARQVASLLRPKDIKQVKQQIGDHRYDWLMSQWTELHDKKAISQVTTPLDNKSLIQALFLIGLRGVAEYVSKLPRPFRIRFFMKLHPQTVAVLKKAAGGSSEEMGKLLVLRAGRNIQQGCVHGAVAA